MFIIGLVFVVTCMVMVITDMLGRAINHTVERDAFYPDILYMWLRS